MKHIIFIALLFCTFSARAQYPTHPTKQELGRQTTGDGLTFRGSGAPAYTPTGKNNAWMFLDTLSGTLYAYRGGSWQLVNAGGVTDVSISNDTLYITTADSTFFAVFDDANTNFANTNLTFTGNRVHNLSTRTLTIADGGTYPTFQQSAATDAISLYSTAKDFAYFTPGLVEMGSDAQLNILADDTITVTASRIRLNAADTRVQQVSKDNALNRVMMIDSLTGRLYYRDVSSIAGGGGTVTGTGTTGTIPVWSSSTALGDSPLTVSSGSVTATGTGFFLPPVGTTAQRPGTPTAGMTRYSTSSGTLEYYGASAWEVPVKSASATGLGTAGRVFYADAAGRAAADDALHYDAANNRLGVNNTAPATTLEVNGTIRSSFTSGSIYTDLSTGVSGSFSINPTSSRMGINVSAPTNTLHIRPLSGQATFRVESYGNTSDDAGEYIFARAKGTPASPTTLSLTTDRVFRLMAQGRDASTMRTGADFSAYVDGTVSSGNVPMRFVFATVPVGGGASPVRRMTITSEGLIGIGDITPARTLHVAGEARITDLTTDTPTQIVGADADGDLGSITVGSGLSLSSGTLSATGGTGTTNLAFSGSSSPVTLTSDTGTDVIFAAGSGLSLTQSGGTATYARTYSLIHATITGGSTFFGTTAERPDNDTPGSATTSAVGSDFSVSGSTIDYTGGSGALIRVQGSISFSVADDGDYYVSMYKEGTEIGATSMRVSCVAGNYYSISLPATTTSGSTNDTFDLRIATVSGNSTTTMHRYGFIIERIY